MADSQRTSWLFVFSPSEVREAAERLFSYHRARVKHWSAERDKAEEDLKSSGIEFRDHFVTGGKSIEAVVDSEKAKHFQNCRDKVTNHEKEMYSFELWIRALKRKKGDLTLSIDDIQFFEL